MPPVKTGAKRRRTVLFLFVVLGLGLSPSARADLFDVTVAAPNPGVLISPVGGCPLGAPLAASHLEVIGAGPTGGLRPQPGPSVTPPEENLTFPGEALAGKGARVPATTSAWMPGGIYAQSSPNHQGGIPERQAANGDFDPDGAVNFAAIPRGFTGAMVSGDTSPNDVAPFSSMLLLLGCALMGLMGLRYRRRRG